ncbi:MAG: CinA family protein [Chloroflexota bacterium]
MTGADAADELTPLIDLAQSAGAALKDAGLTMATAESCTGGLIGHVLTEVSGSSDYYLGGLVSYSDALKRNELGVSVEMLEKHGAVSAQTAVAMAEGARKRYATDVAIAVTGIAGPSGGSAAKPVGLTYVAVADKVGHEVRRHQWSGDRHANKVASAGAALTLLVERLRR